MKRASGFREVSGTAPATIGNFAVRFDVMGAALAATDGSLKGDQVTIRTGKPGSTGTFVVEGKYAHLLPEDPKKNLVLYCLKTYHQALRTKGLAPEVVDVVLQKNLPLASGLGSSSSSIVAALFALNIYYELALDPDELLELAGHAEGSVSGSPHLDNVAPALFGGLQLIAPDASRPLGQSIDLPFFKNWQIVVVHPELEVPTKKARAILPQEIPLKKAVAYWQNLGAFLHALHVKDQVLAAGTFRDLLIEGYRQPLVKGFAEVQAAALQAGAFGCTLSGSGPSMFAVTTTQAVAKKVKAAMIKAFLDQGVASDGWLCHLETSGARATIPDRVEPVIPTKRTKNTKKKR